MFLFKSKKPIEPEKQASQVNEDLELVTKMNQEFAVSLDLNDTLKTALQVIIARLNAEAANIFLINDKKKKFECIASLHQNYLDEYELDLKDCVFFKALQQRKCIRVGNVRNIVVSDQSGKSNIISRLKSIKINIEENDPKIKKLLDEVKDREFIGYSYDGADASFELLASRIIGEIPRYISINEYDVSVKKNKSGEIVSSAKAQLEVDGEKIVCEGEGNGPVNALDNAIRENVDRLAKYSKYLKDLKLVDYKVRILNTGTEATTRVSIESTDSQGKNWFTIGVSPNIIDASFKALIDSLDFKLFKDKAPASK